MRNPYLELTADFNQGRLRALLSSGQAHRLVTSRAAGVLPYEPAGEAQR
jgi:hypothetical protein